MVKKPYKSEGTIPHNLRDEAKILFRGLCRRRSYFAKVPLECATLTIFMQEIPK